ATLGFLHGRDRLRSEDPRPCPEERRRFGRAPAPSPILHRRAHVDLERPGFGVLPVEKGEALDDTLDIEHAVPAGVGVREAFAYLIAVKGGVADEMADKDAL